MISEGVGRIFTIPGGYIQQVQRLSPSLIYAFDIIGWHAEKAFLSTYLFLS